MLYLTKCDYHRYIIFFDIRYLQKYFLDSTYKLKKNTRRAKLEYLVNLVSVKVYSNRNQSDFQLSIVHETLPRKSNYTVWMHVHSRRSIYSYLHLQLLVMQRVSNFGNYRPPTLTFEKPVPWHIINSDSNIKTPTTTTYFNNIFFDNYLLVSIGEDPVSSSLQEELSSMA